MKGKLAFGVIVLVLVLLGFGCEQEPRQVDSGTSEQTVRAYKEVTLADYEPIEEYDYPTVGDQEGEISVSTLQNIEMDSVFNANWFPDFAMLLPQLLSLPRDFSFGVNLSVRDEQMIMETGGYDAIPLKVTTIDIEHLDMILQGELSPFMALVGNIGKRAVAPSTMVSDFTGSVVLSEYMTGTLEIDDVLEAEQSDGFYLELDINLAQVEVDEALDERTVKSRIPSAPTHVGTVTGQFSISRGATLIIDDTDYLSPTTYRYPVVYQIDCAPFSIEVDSETEIFTILPSDLTEETWAAFAEST